MASDWTAKKLEVLVDIPDRLNLEHLRSQGPQPGEELQPEDAPGGGAAAAAAAPAAVQPDEDIVSQLVGMGFSENGSRRAAVATQVGFFAVFALVCVPPPPLSLHPSNTTPFLVYRQARCLKYGGFCRRERGMKVFLNLTLGWTQGCSRAGG